MNGFSWSAQRWRWKLCRPPASDDSNSSLELGPIWSTRHRAEFVIFQIRLVKFTSKPLSLLFVEFTRLFSTFHSHKPRWTLQIMLVVGFRWIIAKKGYDAFFIKLIKVRLTILAQPYNVRAAKCCAKQDCKFRPEKKHPRSVSNLQPSLSPLFLITSASYIFQTNLLCTNSLLLRVEFLLDVLYENLGQEGD